MSTEAKSFDWRVPVVWIGIFGISLVTRSYVEVTDAARRGQVLAYDRVFAIEVASHIVAAALVPVLYWMHRRWPVREGLHNVAIHVLGVVPYSLFHTLGMAALRQLWFNAVLGEAYSFPLTTERLTYEFAKDVFSYGMLSGGVLGMRYLFARPPPPPAAPSPEFPAPPAEPSPPNPQLPERFAVRRRGKEIMVEVADIDWVEAAGNYAVLHVGGETLEIRSSLTRLESELDPKRFVRVHKSHLVNIARVVEVTPWVSGDWRIRLQDGAEVNLSRRYRQRFEALVPIRS